MGNNKTWVGKYVQFIDEGSHKYEPFYYPIVGTFGIVTDEDEGQIEVQWPKNTTSEDDKWWCFKADVELMHEPNSENVLRYGWVITDDETFTDNAEWAGCIRIRLISYCDNLYYHKMVDDEVVDFKPVGKANA